MLSRCVHVARAFDGDYARSTMDRAPAPSDLVSGRTRGIHHPDRRVARAQGQWIRPRSKMLLTAVAAVVSTLITACGPEERPQARYVPLAELEKVFGPIITAANHPTSDQNGTGDRLGLFRDAENTIWGLPLIIANDGQVLGCAPAGVRDARITDTYPEGLTIIGATNVPSGHRGGTGKLELVLRDTRGNVRWQAVNGAQTASGPVCWAQEPPGPRQSLGYYRLAPAVGGK